MLYYYMYGHVETLGHAVAKGARQVEGTTIDIKRVPGLMPRENAGAKLDQAAPIAEPGDLACDDRMSTLTFIEARSAQTRGQILAVYTLMSAAIEHIHLGSKTQTNYSTKETRHD